MGRKGDLTLKNDFTFVCNFTTGRSGTAYLSQVFGHKKWEKDQKTRLRCHEGKYLTVHEAGFDIPVEAIKSNKH